MTRLYGRKNRYEGFRLDAAVIAVCALIGVWLVLAFVFHDIARWFLWGIVCIGFVFNVLLSVKNIRARDALRSIVCVAASAGLLCVAVASGIYLYTGTFG